MKTDDLDTEVLSALLALKPSNVWLIEVETGEYPESVQTFRVGAYLSETKAKEVQQKLWDWAKEMGVAWDSPMPIPRYKAAYAAAKGVPLLGPSWHFDRGIDLDTGLCFVLIKLKLLG